MEDLKNCHYDPESDNPPKPRRGWWWVLALVVVLGALVAWIQWPTPVDAPVADVSTKADDKKPLDVDASSTNELRAADKTQSAEKPAVGVSTEKESTVDASSTSSNALAKTKPSKPKKTEPAEPEYEFYTLLQKQEVIIPEEELEKHRPEAPTLKPGVYVLQVGSFRTQPQAARSRARLAKHGLEASIQRVTSKDEKVWFRVRIGPYIDPDELRATRDTLIDLHINSIPIRLR